MPVLNYVGAAANLVVAVTTTVSLIKGAGNEQGEKQADGLLMKERRNMTGYMADIRKLVGHRTVMQCAASVICVDDANRVLMGRRSDNHMWGYSGGAAEIDERAEDCAKRELYEEMGLIADELEFFCVNSGPQAHYIYPNGDEVSNFEIVYLCRRWHGTVEARDGEMTELRFFAAEEIDIAEVSSPIRCVVEELVKRLDRKKDKE